MMKKFGFSIEVGTLTISLFVAGYCVGPILWGPLSEQYGRRPIFIIAFFVYTASGLGSSVDFVDLSTLFIGFPTGRRTGTEHGTNSHISFSRWYLLRLNANKLLRFNCGHMGR